MQGFRGAVSRLPWIWGVLLAALIATGFSTPAAARQILAPPSIHKASAPVDGHQLALSAKHHRVVHHAIRRFTPGPVLASEDAGVPLPSTLQRVAAPMRAALPRVVATHLPPKTGPPLA